MYIYQYLTTLRNMNKIVITYKDVCKYARKCRVFMVTPGTAILRSPSAATFHLQRHVPLTVIKSRR